MSETINTPAGILDTRTGVGLLTRNIKISSAAAPNNWGGRVLIYGYEEINEDITIPPVWRNGYAKIQGVEFVGLSQYDTTNAAIRIENIGSREDAPVTEQTVIEASSIHGCEGKGMFIDDVANVTINNNVFF